MSSPILTDDEIKLRRATMSVLRAWEFVDDLITSHRNQSKLIAKLQKDILWMKNQYEP